MLSLEHVDASQLAKLSNYLEVVFVLVKIDMILVKDIRTEVEVDKKEKVFISKEKVSMLVIKQQKPIPFHFY